MKTKRNLFYMLLAATGLFCCCTNEEWSDTVPHGEGMCSQSTIAPPLSDIPTTNVNEDGIEASDYTRSYFNNTSSGWTYCWETGDEFEFYVKRNGTSERLGRGITDNMNGSYQINLNFREYFETGDLVYCYLNSTGQEVAQRPEEVTMEIPSEQYTDWGNDVYVSRWCQIRVATDSVGTTSQTSYYTVYSPAFDTPTRTDNVESDVTTFTPANATLTFTIGSFAAGQEYTYSTDGTGYLPLTVDEEGNASIEVSFHDVTLGNEYATAESPVYVRRENVESVRPVTLTARALVSSTTVEDDLGASCNEVSTAYAIAGIQSGSYAIRRTIYLTHNVIDTLASYTNGQTKIIPARNAMPVVGTPYTVPSSKIHGRSSIMPAITYRMLGSLAEFRIFSNDPAIGVGDTIRYISITSANGFDIAGTFTEDLTTSDYQDITGVTGSNCVTAHVENAGYTIGSNKNDYDPIDVVVAPGTFNMQLLVMTDNYIYTKNYSSMKYSKATRKSFSVDLSTATRVPVGGPTIYQVTTSLTNAKFDYYQGDEVEEGYTFTAVLLPKLRYYFKENAVRVTMDGVDITADVYNPSTGMISIHNVSGDISIEATGTYGTATVNYVVGTSLVNCKFSEDVNTTIRANAPFRATIVPLNERCTIETVSVRMGDVYITDQVYNSATGEVYIPAMTGHVVIEAYAHKDPLTFNVAVTTDHCTLNGNPTVLEDDTYVAELIPEQGYVISNVQVIMRGYDMTYMAYDNGQICIPLVNGNITITATAVPAE